MYATWPRQLAIATPAPPAMMVAAILLQQLAAHGAATTGAGGQQSHSISSGIITAGAWVTAAGPPIVLGRSRSPHEDLLDPIIIEGGDGRLLVAASTAASRKSPRLFAATAANATSFVELESASASVAAALNHSASLGVCLPPSAEGTICLGSDAVVEVPDPAHAARIGVLRSVVLLVSDSGGDVSASPHAALALDMTNASHNMSLQIVPGDYPARSNFRPQAVVADGSELVMLLVGQFELPPPPPPRPGCRRAASPKQQAPPTSLVTLASADQGLTWQYRSVVALAPPPSSDVPTATDLRSGAPDQPIEPTCTPACAKGDVCASSSPRVCVAAVCHPTCGVCEVCDRGVCVPGEVRYVTAFPPVLVGEGAVNGSVGHELLQPQLHALLADPDPPDPPPRRALGGSLSAQQHSVITSPSRLPPSRNTTIVLRARTGMHNNLTRSFVAADSLGEQWEEVHWVGVANVSNASEIPAAHDPASFLVCFPWAANSTATVCVDRRLQRNVSRDIRGRGAVQALEKERFGFLSAGLFRLVSSVRHGLIPRLVGALNVSVNMSGAATNMSAGHVIMPTLPSHYPAQFFDAELHGTPAVLDKNGTLIQLMTVSWSLDLSTCLRAQNKLCKVKWRQELQYGARKAGACSRCLADHISELAAADCNDTDAERFCSTPGLPSEEQSHVVAILSTDGRHWHFHSHIPPFLGSNSSVPNDGLPLGMDTADMFAPWTCSLDPVAADVQAVDVGTGSPLLFAVWQPTLLPNGATCGAKSWDGGRTWMPTNELAIRRTSAATDGSNQNAPAHAEGGPPRLASLGALGGVAITDGLCGSGQLKVGAGLWLWSTSALGLNSSHNATPSLQGTNLAQMHNNALHRTTKGGSWIKRSYFTSDFVNGISDARESSGVTDIHLLRSNKTHSEVLVVYDRLPGAGWNGTQSQVFAMRLVVSSVMPPARPCVPKCKKGTTCVHTGPTGPDVTPYGQRGQCKPLKPCKKPACKPPQKCDELTGHCFTPPAPSPQSCLGPVAATITRMAANATDPNSNLLAVWQPFKSEKPFGVSMCRAVSRDSGRSWLFLDTVHSGKGLSSVHSFGVSPQVAFAPTGGGGGATDGGGVVVMSQGRASASGIGLSLWLSRVSHAAGPAAPGSLKWSDDMSNLAALHNDYVALNATLEFTDGFVDGRVDPQEAGAATAIHVLGANSSHAELLALYTKSKGAFMPNWYSHIGYVTKLQQADSILFALRVTIGLTPPPPPANRTASRIKWLTWYDAYTEEQMNMTSPGPNLILNGGDPQALHDQATHLGVQAMWAFNRYCIKGMKIFQEPYCGVDRVYCLQNSTMFPNICPFGKACPAPGSTACPTLGPGGSCKCPVDNIHQLAINWTNAVRNVATLLADKPRIVGLWMGDEPEINGMSGDSLCAVASEMKRALFRVGRPDIFIMVRRPLRTFRQPL